MHPRRVGELALEKMRREGVTQRELARVLGISQGSLSKLLRTDPKRRNSGVRALEEWAGMPPGASADAPGSGKKRPAVGPPAVAPRRIPQQDRSRARVERILRAASTLYGEGREVSMREIAAAAGVPIASVYQYYPDKTALLRALGMEFYARMRARFAAALPHLTRWQDATAFAHAMIDGLVEELGAPDSHMSVWSATQAVKVLRELDWKDGMELAEMVRIRITEITEGLDPDALRDFCMFAVATAGPILRQSFVAGKADGDRIIREFKELIRLRIERLGATAVERRPTTSSAPRPRRKAKSIRPSGRVKN